MCKEIMTIQNVRGYLDEQGTAWLNIEDVARGLGFTQNQNKNGKVYTSIRWETINRYLKAFGFPQLVGEKDYIPENMFYRLAMKAKNEVAERFQAIVADEILPTIRKTGSYSVKKQTIMTPLEAVKQVVEISNQLQRIKAMQSCKAIAHAVSIVEPFYGNTLEPIRKILPPNEDERTVPVVSNPIVPVKSIVPVERKVPLAVKREIEGFNPTQIGKRLGGINPREVNKMLAEAGLQYKKDRFWRLTTAGTIYAKEIFYTRNNCVRHLIRWYENVFVILKYGYKYYNDSNQ